MNTITKSKKSNYAFIDTQNLRLGLLNSGWEIDFQKFRVFLKDKYNIVNAYLFMGYIQKNRSLYIKLSNYGYTIIFKPTISHYINGTKQVKGNIDAELVLKTMIEFRNYHKAVIVSGDGDFYCLIDYLKKNSKLCKILVPNKKFSSLLRKFAKEIVIVEYLKSKIKKAGGIP